MSDNDGILHWDERAQPALDVPDVEARLRARIAELEAEVDRLKSGRVFTKAPMERVRELEAEVARLTAALAEARGKQ